MMLELDFEYEEKQNRIEGEKTLLELEERDLASRVSGETLQSRLLEFEGEDLGLFEEFGDKEQEHCENDLDEYREAPDLERFRQYQQQAMREAYDRERKDQERIRQNHERVSREAWEHEQKKVKDRERIQEIERLAAERKIQEMERLAAERKRKMSLEREILDLEDRISEMQTEIGKADKVEAQRSVKEDEDVSKEDRNNFESAIVGIAKSMQDQASVQSRQAAATALLSKHPEIFSDDFLMYNRWEQSFETLVVPYFGATDCLWYLGEYTGDQAKASIQHLLEQNSEAAYTEARRLLKERYGDEFSIATQRKKKLMNFPEIYEGNSDLLRKFSDMLRANVTAMKDSKYLDFLDNADFNLELTKKLPAKLRGRWSLKAHHYRNSHGSFPRFEVFVDFVEDQAKLATDPILGWKTLADTERKPKPDDQRGHKHGSFTGAKNKFKAATTDFREHGGQGQGRKTRYCVYCKKDNHDTDYCRQFASLSLAERVSYMKGRCYACYGPTSRTHYSRICENRLKCRECGYGHPTLLHDESRRKSTPNGSYSEKEKKENEQADPKEKKKEEPSSKVKSAATSFDDEESEDEEVKTVMTYVLVLVESDGNPGKFVKTYAFLDSLASKSFISKDLCAKLDSPISQQRKFEMTTMAGTVNTSSALTSGIRIYRLDGTNKQQLPKLIVREKLPLDATDVIGHEEIEKLPHLRHLLSEIPEFDPSVGVGLLIGQNAPRVVEPWKSVRGNLQEPYAVKTKFGWSICGPLGEQDANEHKVNFVNMDTKQKDIDALEMLKCLYNLDYVEKDQDEKKESIEDRKFIELMDSKAVHENGHYVLPLPLKGAMEKLELPDNRDQALNLAKRMKDRMMKSPKMKEDFVEFMDGMEEKGYSRRVPDNSINAKPVWYVPYHGVYHPQKKKFRAVFNCSKEYEGISLNQVLMQGPAQDLTNNMAGILIRFRKEQFAFLADIEKMFYQAKVPEDQMDLLRYFWWPKGDFEKPPVEMQMCCHLFGSVSSPAIASYALKRTAADFGSEHSEEAVKSVQEDFYVDDLLKSVKSVEEAVKLALDIREICLKGGFNLTKFMSSHQEILDGIPPKSRAKVVKELDLGSEMQVERVLGIVWIIENDSLCFRVVLKDRPWTRRGLLSNLASITDLLGLISPFILTGKRILQELCYSRYDWDDQLDTKTKKRWSKWIENLMNVDKLKIPRCYRSPEFGEVVESELHAYADASGYGYGSCVFLRERNERGDVNCALVMGKARVVPLTGETTPRSELVAAVTAAETAHFVKKQLKIEKIPIYLWTDSQIVLSYVLNGKIKTRTSVTNRRKKIRKVVEASNMRHVPGELNPADDASRGLKAENVDINHRWFKGPDYLYEAATKWPKSEIRPIDPADPEVAKTVKTCATKTTKDGSLILEMISRYSKWQAAVNAIVRCLKFRRTYRETSEVEIREIAKRKIYKALQEKHFELEIAILKLKGSETEIRKQYQKRIMKTIPKDSDLYKLDPFIDIHGLLRVGGRIEHSEIEDTNLIHPIILPGREEIVAMIIRYLHEQVDHCGRNSTLNEMRRTGLWIIHANTRTRSVLNKCVTCRKTRRPTELQKMAALPADRLKTDPPFTYVGVDMFGPFYVKEGRKVLKRYGAIFTCLCSRAIHIEVTNNMETDSFMNALRRFISRRGNIRLLRSDNGSNFVGAKRQLQNCWSEISHETVKEYLKNTGCDFEWKMNIPASSHHGGVWERCIATVRQVLSSLLVDHPCQLTTETLTTLMVEVEGIVNSRPLTTETISDPESPLPISPINLLTMKSRVVLPPPGEFDDSADIYTRKHWRRVQHLAQEFWTRYRQEYLSQHQSRAKWQKEARNLEIDDIVLLKDDNVARNEWPLGRVVEVHADKKGLVRSAKVRLPRQNLRAKIKYLERPIVKLVVLVEADNLSEH